MQKIKWVGKQKQINYQLQILLLEMGFFKNLKTKKIKFNLKPKKETKRKTEPETPEFIDLHVEIISKIDEIIKKNELQTINNEESIEKTTITQIRKPWTRTPKRSLFETETIQDTFKKNDTLFELERGPSFNQNINNLTPLSNKVTSFDEPLTIENIDFVEKIDNNPNLLTGLGRIKINKNPNQTITKKAMDVTIVKTNLEKTKQELEIRKHELEEMQRLAKEKEEELKKKEEEEKKLERLNKIQQKELEKEKKIKERQLKFEKKKQEKINKIKEKELEKENKIIEKQLLIELERQEKLKKIEEEKLLKEQEMKKILKEQEEKEKLLARQQKIEEVISKKEREKEDKQSLLTDQEKMKELEKKSGFKKEIKTQKPAKTNNTELANIDLSDEELGQFLKIVDNLLEKLPEDIIIEFIQSKDYEIYEKVLNKYNIK